HRLASEKPHRPAMLAIARNVEEIAGAPVELDGEASPLIQEPPSVVERAPPFRTRNPHGLLALQPRPAIKVGLRHAVHCQGFELFAFDIGLGRSGYSRYRPICQLAVFNL